MLEAFYKYLVFIEKRKNYITYNICKSSFVESIQFLNIYIICLCTLIIIDFQGLIVYTDVVSVYIQWSQTRRWRAMTVVRMRVALMTLKTRTLTSYTMVFPPSVREMLESSKCELTKSYFWTNQKFNPLSQTSFPYFWIYTRRAHQPVHTYTSAWKTKYYSHVADWAMVILCVSCSVLCFL